MEFIQVQNVGQEPPQDPNTRSHNERRSKVDAPIDTRLMPAHEWAIRAQKFLRMEQQGRPWKKQEE